MNPPPFRRSWVDSVIAGVRTFPGPPWVLYLGGALIFVTLGTGVTWIDGSQPVGTFTFTRVYNDAYVLYPLAVMHFLSVTAERAMAAFRPALGELEPEFEHLTYEFTHMRRPFVNVITLVGTAYVALSLIYDPAVAGLAPDSSLLSWIVLGSFGVIAGVTFVILVFFVVRLLVLILRVHRRATNVDLFNAQAHGAFARLTLPSSFGLALPVYIHATYSIAVGPPSEGIGLSDLLAVIAQVVAAIAVFFIPLWGMNRRLVAAKAHLITQINRRFADTAQAIHTKADSHQVNGVSDLQGVGDLNTLLSALLTERDVVKRLSTWPWEADTLRGFLSSIALPIVVWLATNLLGRLFGS
jgi:hypothetical protein